MKKKILFGVIALVTILAFTGCDKILEFMFPDATGGGNWGANTIIVQITVDDAIEDWSNYTIYTELSESTDEGAFPVPDAYRSGYATTPFNDPTAAPTASFRYDGLVDGKTYSVRVWMDVNPEFGAQSDDPQALAGTNLGLTAIQFPLWDAESGTTMTTANLFATLAPPPDAIDEGTPYVFVKGDLVYDVNAAYLNFYLDTTVEDRYFDSVYFDIYDPNWNYLTSGSVFGSDYIYFNLSYYVGYYGWYDGTYHLVITSAETNGEATASWVYDTPFRLIYPTPSQYAFYPDVSGYGFDGWPYFMDWGTYFPVLVNYYDEYGNFQLQQDNYTGVSGGSFYASPYWDSYQFYTYNPVNSGYADVFVDRDNDGDYYGAQDIATRVPFYLDYWMYDYGGYLWPTYDANPARFVPVSDFNRFYYP